MIKIYLAAASREPTRVSRALDAIERTPGAVCCARWPLTLLDRRFRGLSDEDLTAADQRVEYLKNQRDMLTADLVWALAPDQSTYTTGFWTDVIFAIDRGQSTIITGPTARDHIGAYGATARIVCSANHDERAFRKATKL